jgi:hypothetical protein
VSKEAAVLFFLLDKQRKFVLKKHDFGVQKTEKSGCAEK